ncbi:WD repeat, SAM and U-box domain-containing protein 1-like [Amyelois transitella]|uniref:WD repeat, SAM and U-box domain-containing protein 1-like n=1 Tax=Amyelois transitella TaxID=680683 RepID=UPI00298F60E1|nr:WD repeat, SAM and U-box domain-containing protein 1-like [Amyelois transitella]
MEDIGLSEPVLLQTLRAHRSEVTCADVDPTGARLVTGSGDRALRLWRWQPGGGWEETAVVRDAHRYGVTGARWSPHGALACSGGVDGAARVWCGRALASRRVLSAPAAAAARALCWAGGGRLLVGHDDGALCVWHVLRATLLARHVAHAGSLQSVAVTASHTLLLTACTEGVLKVFDLNDVCNSGIENEPSPAPLTWIDSAHDLGVLCADAVDDGCLAATGGHDALVRVWRRAEGGRGLQEQCSLAGHAAAVTALRWARGAALLASASLDRSARLWRPAAAACLHVLHAHPRYLTCVAVDPQLRYIITGSNDKSVRMFSLRQMSLDAELEPPCNALEHFGLGDLEGIGPVEEEAAGFSEARETSDAHRVWSQADAHAGAINCVATHGDIVATASSDGTVKVFHWSRAGLELVHSLAAHEYPALAVSAGADGALLLSASLDCTAKLWDVQMGCQLRSLCAGVRGSVEGEGGGGVRDARVSPHRPPLLLLAADDGVAPLWSLADADPNPAHLYEGDGSAMTCCAWSACGRVAATGAASGELRLFAPPPACRQLHHQPSAHDMGVQSCDFLPDCGALGLPAPARSCVLATAGADSLIKLWLIELHEDEAGATVRLARTLEAHGGGVTSARWQPRRGARALLASAGADRWVRVWRLHADQDALELNLSAVCAVSAAESRGALAVAMLEEPRAGAECGALLVVGALGGGLSLWRLPPDDDDDTDDEGSEPRFWTQAGVVRWLREYVFPVCASSGSDEAKRLLQLRARTHRVTGARLLDDDTDDLLATLFADEEDEELPEEVRADVAALKDRLVEELKWLRRSPPPVELEQRAPHALRCPLSHRVLREPARAADGLSYERAALREFFLAADGAISPVSGRRLSNARVAPNYALRDKLRAFLAESGHVA